MGLQAAARRISSRYRLLPLVIAGLPLGCGGGKVGDLHVSVVELTLLAFSSDAEVAAVGEPAGGLGVSRAFVSASSLTLLPCSQGAADIALSPAGYELLGDEVASEVVTTAVLELCALRLDIDPVTQSRAEGVPEGAAIYLEGRSDEATAFALTGAGSTSLLLEAEPGASFGGLPLILGFDLGVWLSGVRPDVDSDIETQEPQLAASAAVYNDSNANELLDEDELSPVAWVR